MGVLPMPNNILPRTGGSRILSLLFPRRREPIFSPLLLLPLTSSPILGED